MIRKALLLKLLDAAYMQRWNDKIRTVELIELDKQAHKMIVAYFLARTEEEGGTPVRWPRLVEAGIFELLQRIVITDLKPQIFYKIKADAGKYRQLNDWVYGELRPVISPLGKAFVRRYQDHFLEAEESVERRILDAAHYYATRAHETIHWTGHTDRLDRDLTGRFGEDAYAAEELVAELGAAMWCAQTGLTTITRADHAAYLAGWLRILRSDARALVTVASRAQAAVDWLNTHTGHTIAATVGEVAA